METGRQRQPERCALLKMPSTKQPNCQTSIIRHTPSGEQTRRPKPTEVPDNAIACTGTSDNLDTNPIREAHARRIKQPERKN